MRAAPSVALINDLVPRLFPHGPRYTVERVTEGVSTFVYRLTTDEHSCYLRVLPEAGSTFAPEVRVHQVLRARGVLVPDLLCYEPYVDALGLSVMVTTTIPGQSIAQEGLGPATPATLVAAGRDLALINSVAVAGFGWLDRHLPTPTALTAEHPSNRAFRTELLEADLARLGENILGPAVIAALHAIIARYDYWLDVPQAHLAHGDFDVTHIFAHAGRYSGIIDFGEIRGTDRWYDLGHFALRDGERFATPLLPDLLAGYRSVTPLPTDAEARITFSSLLIGLRLLARSVEKRGQANVDRSALRAVKRALMIL
ncbi:MAG TPA: aminoglycoside phosphotransferase family protein [Thermomicrobiales bacterium]|jgi:aminoglycoside phosphotransferase (APT) family kinase protein